MSSYDHFTPSLGDDSGDDEQTETLSSRRDLEKKDRSELIADIQEMAEQLIGVTMNEPGVSRIVGVDVSQALRMAQAA